MKSFTQFLNEAKATYCGRCGTTHVPPSQGGTCPALKKEGNDLEEGFENLPGKATHLTKVDVRHPEHGIISGSTTLRHLGGNKYEVRAGRAKGKTVALDDKHVQKLSEEADLSEEIKKGDFVKDPHGKIHRVFDVKGNMLSTGEYRGNDGYGGTNMLHKAKATKVPTPKDVTEEIGLDEDFTKMDTPSLKKWITTRERNSMAANLSKKRGDQYDQAQVELKRRQEVKEEAEQIDESDLHAQMAAFTAKHGGRITTSDQRKKETAELMAKRAKEAESRPKAEPQPYKEKYPLGGYDRNSGRSYSEQVDVANRKVRFSEYSEMYDSKSKKQ